ncbi:Membrane-associated phospholipid phosphatase [Sphingomonas sp. S17]|uniref:Acid phosphatase n=2 Tax=Sphingomonas paucimobilis TaxID=13689 RepID=A0A7Y2KNE9_SPHPI|nr:MULTISPECIES: phosphatase PAP2 family protein [Sphingomonas]EGI55613.1 Membrane-associated phospholipid phosphatase [Sphingomonas sp. S17]MBQ1480703.1 phosphatase PAP2 family protein [Sphingomonas sp.]MCM3680348.1 phosphatase PAP2 family protein [Sphingomonas paucimobilis]MDG5970488.1 phosphatase PAP2 family protein [Sphingomonas paucimobilis]NNG57209.1 phosphatase PAP2 family protein [Sphingomonas paucimobilis]
MRSMAWRMGLVAMLVLSSAVPAGARDKTGYLPVGEGLDLATILPGPPTPGSPRAKADAQLFRDSRAMQGSPRWQQATADVSSDLGDRFATALGFRPDWSRLPVTKTLIARFDADRSAAIRVGKAHWQSARPFIGTDLPICEPRTPSLIANGDYPSGHTAHGWGFALIMAELLPDRAQAILARGRDYGDSRWICGSHTMSAVEGGYLAASAIVAREHGDAAFRRDMAAAAEELAAYRRGLKAANPR